MSQMMKGELLDEYRALAARRDEGIIGPVQFGLDLEALVLRYLSARGGEGVPAPGDTWTGEVGTVAGRVIRVDDIKGNTVIYTVVHSPKGHRTRREGRLSMRTLRSFYRLTSREGDADG